MLLATLIVVGSQQFSEVGGEWEAVHHFVPEIGSPHMAAEYRPTVEIGDIDQDGTADFAFNCSGSASIPGVFAVSGETGQELWRFEYLAQLGLGMGPKSLLSRIDDVDGDGIRDLVAGNAFAQTSVGRRFLGFIAVHSGRTGDLLWMTDDDDLGGGLGYSAAGVGDQNADGVPDISITTSGSVSGIWTSALHTLSGIDGTLIKSITSSVSYPSFAGLADRDSLVDLDGDGLLDVIVQVDSNQLDVYSIASGQVLASYFDSHIMIGPGNNSSLAVPDMTGDGIPDLITPIDSGIVNEIHLLDRVSGQEVWRRTLPGSYVAEFDLGGDWDGDGIVDFAVGLPDRQVSGFPQQYGVVDLRRGSNGKLIRRIEVGVLGLAEEDGFGSSVTYDETSESLFVREWSPLAGRESPPLIRLQFSRFLEGDASTVSATQGGLVVLDLEFPDDMANMLYSIGVSCSGIGPTDLRGLEIPLSMDRWLRASINGTLPPVIAFRTGTLDSFGKATAFLGFPPNVLTSAVGSSFWMAAVSGDSPVSPIASSAAWRIDIAP